MLREDCPCVKKRCPRHGDCDACTAHHQGRRRPPYCQRSEKRTGRLRGAGRGE